MFQPLMPSLHKPRILVVEDEILVARDIQEQLLLLGYEPLGHATHGEEVVPLSMQLHPDLVLMDIQLAGNMDGIAAALALRTTLATPVVFLTAFDADETLARAKLAEPYGYLLKPFSERDLRTVLEMALYKCQAETRLRETVNHTQAILDAMQDGVMHINAQGVIQSCNPAACQMFGYTEHELKGLTVLQLIPTQHRSKHVIDIQQNKKTTGEPCAVEGLRKDGCVIQLTVAISSLPQDGAHSFVAVTHDLSAHHKNAEDIHRLAFYDQLTGLPNRHWFKEHAQQATATSARSGLHAALLLLDLDDFKIINDTHGLDLGDLMLKEVALRLKTRLRAGDVVARLGGDEFVVLLQGLDARPDEAATQTETTAKQLLQALTPTYKLGPVDCTSAGSMGVVVFQGASQSVDELLKRADIALYQAKNGGRNTLRFYDAAMQAAVLAHAERFNDLSRGLANQEFVLYFQPQVNRHGHLIGAEALIRWQHPTRGMVPPGDFITLAEESKLILPMGQWVLEQACAQVSAWANNLLTRHWVLAINVSALQFAQVDFVDKVQAALELTGANPNNLKLELTESMLVTDVPGVIAKIKKLKLLGVSFSLDDFGTGYSSLCYLKRLPLDQLKIDQSFVCDLLTDPNDTAIAHAVIAMGHSLGLKVIAEGVETPMQRDILAGLHCDAFQGYFFGRPMKLADLEQIANKNAL